jgi:hypothetical protein
MLTAASFRYEPGPVPEMARLLRAWLDGWDGMGRIVVGMTRQGYDLQLTQYDREGWRATFFPEGRTHSMTQAVGTAYEGTPAAAVRAAASAMLAKAEGAT